MIFSLKSIEDILTGKKTQTRRLVKDGDMLSSGLHPLYSCPDCVYRYTSKGQGTRTKWKVGNTYAVQPGRGKPQVARIRILRIWREDVRRIKLGDISAEGFSWFGEFWQVWCGFHDPGADWANGNSLIERPAHRYDAWALEFELVSS